MRLAGLRANAVMSCIKDHVLDEEVFVCLVLFINRAYKSFKTIKVRLLFHNSCYDYKQYFSATCIFK